MARDGLLPQRLSVVSERRGTPVLMTMVTGVIVAAIAGFVPLQRIVELANAGTLVAFIAVAVCMLVMRRRHPDYPRAVHSAPAVARGFGGDRGCIYLFTSLPVKTIVFFFVWMAIGLVVYMLYARHNSALATATTES